LTFKLSVQWSLACRAHASRPVCSLTSPIRVTIRRLPDLPVTESIHPWPGPPLSFAARDAAPRSWAERCWWCKPGWCTWGNGAVLIPGLGFLGMAAVAGGVYAPFRLSMSRYRPLGGVFAVFASSRHACLDGRVLGALLDARSLYARISERLNPASPPRAPAERRHCSLWAGIYVVEAMF
jgi:hypothetical protein